MAGGPIDVVVSIVDCTRAERALGIIPVPEELAEEWFARALHLAWKRETGKTDDFDAFLDQFIGYETQDEALEVDSFEAQVQAIFDFAALCEAGKDIDKGRV